MSKVFARLLIAVLIALPSFAQSEPEMAQEARVSRKLKVITNATADRIAKFDSVGNFVDSAIVETGGNVGIGTTSPSRLLHLTSSSGNAALQFTGSTGKSWHVANAGNDFNLSETGVADARIYVQAGGNVGIGTASPANTLHIQILDGSLNAPLKLQTTGADSTTGISLKNDARNWHIRVDGTDGDKFKIFDANANGGAGAYRLAINDNGYVGVGTSDPKSNLHVYGDPVSDRFAAFGTDPALGPSFNIGYAGLSFGRGAAFMNVRPDPLAVAPNPSLRFATVNAERMIITNTGNVGIGTSAPLQKLHVYSVDDTGTVIQAENMNATGAGVHAALRTITALSATSYVAHGNRDPNLVRFGIPLAGWGEIVNFNGNGYIVGTTLNTPLVFGTYNAERMRILGNGNVGIGTNAPAARLHVAGDVVVSGNITGAKVIGAVYQDLAEWVPSSDDLAPGTVVILDKRSGNTVTASRKAYDTLVAGVVSKQPGIILGEASATKEQIATTGRVKVRVDASKGAVEIGDLLVTSDVSGTAMKSAPIDIGGFSIHRPGTIIGKALEPLASGEGEILVLLSLQ